MEQKQELRRQLLAWRESLPEPVRAAWDGHMTRHLLALPAYQTAGTVFCYVAVPPEPDTSAILGEILSSGRRLLVPRCGKHGYMDAAEITALESLTPGVFDIPEPGPEAPAAAPEEIDLAIVPALACDEQGYRLGRGGGYYDRFLADRRFYAVGFCYAKCHVPIAPYDQPVDEVILPPTGGVPPPCRGRSNHQIPGGTP